MYILGINAYHGDSAAAIMQDGRLLAAVEEERINRVKHWAGLPIGSVKFCLDSAGIKLQDLDFIAVSRDPWARFHKKLFRSVASSPNPGFLKERGLNFKKIWALKNDLAAAFGISKKEIKAKLVNVEHHRSHLASSFFVSPFDAAAVVSIDGFGDFASTMIGIGRGNQIKIIDTVEFPHSLGIFYTALTQFLGFWNYGDEYKVMGLAAFGQPIYLEQMRKIVKFKNNGLFELNYSYFLHQTLSTEMSWLNQGPKVGKLFSDKLNRLVGEVNQADLAASVQAMYEEAFFHVLNHLYQRTKIPKLALAGGCVQNSSANGKITMRTGFKEVYVPPVAHDAGTAVGSAFYVWNQVLKYPRSFVMDSPYWGMEFSESEIEKQLTGHHLKYQKLPDKELFMKTAKLLASGLIVGWFQGKTEFGPRALGNRSILASPQRAATKDILNAQIKHREPFRPFGCSVLQESAADYFEGIGSDPFMSRTYRIRPEKKKFIPAVAHVDGTSRVQTVSKKINSRFWHLINAFAETTGVPVLLNTSFNDNEPIVHQPGEAMDCFLRTGMDALVVENYLLLRHEQ